MPTPALAAAVEPAAPLPIFLHLATRRVLLIGGGGEAAEKLPKLLATGAQLTVVAPVVSPVFRAAASAAGIAPHARAVRPADFAGQAVVVIADTPPPAARRLASLARAQHALVNVVDQPELCDFFFGAQIERGPLQLAIGTNGLFPGVARALREWLEEILPSEVTPELAELATLRRAVRTLVPSPAARLAALRTQLATWSASFPTLTPEPQP